MRIGHASIDEHGKVSNGNAGDQTGKEVCIRNYYDKNWDYVLRPKTSDLAEKSAKACEALCNNQCVGYDQSERNSIIAYLELLGWNYSAIKKDTECDCSSLMTACALCGGAKINYKGNAPHTRSMVARFKESGSYDAFQFVSPKHSNLKRGDILVKEGSHTVMILDDYNAVSNTTKDKKPTLKLGDKSDWVTIAQGRLVVLGYKIAIDGIYGEKTKKAVMELQKAKNLACDGIIGPKTWAALYS